MLRREAEKRILLLWLLALLVGKEYQIDNFLVELPCRGVVEFEVAERNLVAARVVHGKGNIADRRSAIVLRIVPHVCLNV